MIGEKYECLNCGAPMPQGIDVCEFCGSVFELNEEHKDNSIELFYDAKALKVNSGIVKNINSLIKQAKLFNIDIKHIKVLDLNNVGLIDITGIHQFVSVNEIYLQNNNIKTIDYNVLEFFKKQIVKSESFSLFLSGNNDLDMYSILSHIATNEISPDYYDYLTIPTQIDATDLKNEIELCDSQWNRSENSTLLKKEYKSYQSYLEEKTFKLEEEIKYGFDNPSYFFEQHIIFNTDIDTFNLGIDGFFESNLKSPENNIINYTKIKLPDTDTYQKILESRYSTIDFSFIKKYKQVIKKYYSYVYWFIALGFIPTLLFSIGRIKFDDKFFTFQSLFLSVQVYFLIGLPITLIVLRVFNFFQKHPIVLKEIYTIRHREKSKKLFHYYFRKRKVKVS